MTNHSERRGRGLPFIKLFVGLFSRPKRDQPPQWMFRPQPDITAYELAKLTPLLIPARFRTAEIMERKIEELPVCCRRHIVRESDELSTDLEGETEHHEDKFNAGYKPFIPGFIRG